MISVLLADDEELIRAGLRMLLDPAEDITVVAEAADGGSAITMAVEYQPRVALLDVRMPEVDGLSALESILAMDEPPQVIMLTTFDLDEYVHRALRLGASGFLLKDTPPRELVDAVRAVAEGKAIFSPEITKRMIRAYAHQEPGRAKAARTRLHSLTDRERDVAYALADGLSNIEIARSLHMSEATVKAHLSRSLTKLELTNRVQLALLAHDAGFDS